MLISFLIKYVDEDDDETPDEDAVDDLSIKFSLFKFVQLLLLLQSVRSKSSFIIIKLSSLQDEYFDDIVDEDVDVCDVVIILFVIELNGGLRKDDADDDADVV